MRKQRTRLRLLFVVALLVLGQPRHDGWEIGAALIAAGALLHALAAGYLEKNRVLAAAGPYRFVRNPFYLGDFLQDAGVLLACHFRFTPAALPLWGLAGLYFAAMYGVVIRRRVLGHEEPELRARFGELYRRYADAVPRFLPRAWPAPRTGEARFRLATLRRNGELPRLLAALLLIGVAYYRWEAFHHGFSLVAMLNDRWELAGFAALPGLFLASKLRPARWSERWARRLAPAAPLLLVTWAGLLLGVDYGDVEDQAAVWVSGIVLFFAGWGLRFAALAERRAGQSAAGLVTAGVHGVLRQPLALGTLAMLGGLAICAETPWLLPATLCFGAAVMAPVVRREEAALGRRFGSAYASYRRAVPRWGPRWRALKQLSSAHLPPLSRPLLVRELAVATALLPFLVLELFLE